MNNLKNANEKRKENALNKLWNFSKHGIKSFKNLIDAGVFVASKITEEPKIKYNRIKYNRMNNAQQEEYEKSMKQMKIVYNLCYDERVSTEVSKFVFDYYNELQGKEKCAECGKEMNDLEHNYGTEEIMICLHCENDTNEIKEMLNIRDF